MEQKSRQDKPTLTDQPRVFIGIPTGPPKLYSTYFMVAALANLDYENLDIHWATTGALTGTKFQEYRQRICKLVEGVKWKETVNNTIHYVVISPEEHQMAYGPILKNKQLLREKFLDSDAEYFLLLGGDNPPPRRAIKRLMEVDADIAMGTCYQRPGQDDVCGVYPLVWYYLWLPSDLERLEREGLDAANLEELRLAWLHCPLLMNVKHDPNWRRSRTLWNITGGDGCALIKRRVLEMIDWSVAPSQAYHSEDIHFMSLALFYGFTTACATDLHVAHMGEDGVMY